jgi:hypothetical protein
MAVDDLDREVGGRVDAEVDLLLAADERGILEIERFVGLDAGILLPKAIGRRAGHDAREVQFLGEHPDEIAGPLLVLLVRMSRRHEEEVPVEVDQPRPRALAANPLHAAIAAPADPA